jgi:hypothetical protein
LGTETEDNPSIKREDIGDWSRKQSIKQTRRYWGMKQKTIHQSNEKILRHETEDNPLVKRENIGAWNRIQSINQTEKILGSDPSAKNLIFLVKFKNKAILSLTSGSLLPLNNENWLKNILLEMRTERQTGSSPVRYCKP